VLHSVLVAAPCARAEEATEAIDPAELEASNVVIGDVVLEKHNIFDLSDPKENNWLFRLANKWHIITRDEVITKQLLLEPGDRYSKRLSDESERILRSNRYFYDVSIEPVNLANGKVDLRVKTRDVWTLNPGISLSRKGGENETSVDIEDVNLLGRGHLLRVAYTDDVDRTSTSVEFEDKHVGKNWIALNAMFADNSDGDAKRLAVWRPFFALDTRWSAGVRFSAFEERSVLYDLGEQAAEFQQDRRFISAWGGWSKGLQNGWVRRYTAGAVIDEARFADVPTPTLVQAIPDSRKFVYPFLGIEILQDSFETTTNRDQIDRTEDFLTGTRFTATLGWSSEDFGADDEALLLRATASRFFGSLEDTALAVAADASARFESGDTKNARFSASARYSHRFSEKHSFFASLSGTYGHDLDLEAPVELGGDTGLRGYPLRYQTGDSKLLLSLEQRYFWNWYPFRLFRVGGAIFADAGRTWGDHPLGGTELGWLKDAGFGLRFAPTRSGSDKIVHLDIAFPLDGDPTIDDVQIVLESKSTF
jgi:hypothetical protein